MWLFYIPVVFYILYLVVRYRGLSFTAVNPGMPASGFIGENKSLALLDLQKKSPEKTAKTLLVSQKDPLNQQLAICHKFIEQHHLSYPLVAKPDFGQRGIDVEIIKDVHELTVYLQRAVFDTVVQEYVAGVEFGVFYVRQPDESQGHIFSITHKTFPYVVGDGKNTLEQLICEHPRLHYMAEFLLNKYSDQLQMILQADETFHVVTLGSHCRGSLFLEGLQYLTDILEQEIDQVSQSLKGFYFGRYDLRAETIEAFMKGDFKVIEVNGVTSESTNMYDPSNNLLTAYRILFKQWQQAFLVGKKNIKQGYKPLSINDLIEKLKIMNRGN